MPRRTDPKTFLVGGARTLLQLAIPIAIASFTILREGGVGNLILAFGPIVLVAIAFSFAVTYIQWRKLTFTVGEEDIRVESGVLSRNARSVPFERIQDVSLEQALLPRLFGLVHVKFETGSGGGEDISLIYLTESDGEDLRKLVRERRDGAAPVPAGEAADSGAADATQQLSRSRARAEEDSTLLFSMGPRRLLTFGLFEFSLAVFAVLAGVLQYTDNFYDFELEDFGLLQSWFEAQGGWLGNLGVSTQIIGGLLGLLAVLLIGSATGLVRTFLRDWDFRLTHSPRGFRRQRGMFTKTDVVMPVHRVQALVIGTRALRYRFGWHALQFVSLAQDAGSSSHIVAPFAKMHEIDPIVREAGFELPSDEADWHRASTKYRFDATAIRLAFWLIVTAVVAFAAPGFWFVIPLVLGAIFAAAKVYAWTFFRHSLSERQIMATRGFLSPNCQIATRLKLHSVEILSGPLARMRGYATLHLGLAGGTFSIPGVPLERAHAVRTAVLETIAHTDFSELEHG